jgi:hypothetical protein
LAFLDEEQEKPPLVPAEPDRPRRPPGGPGRRRQQILVRRLIAVGVGLAFLILIVIGIRGCLEARSDRGLRNYSQDVGTIMQESEQRGQDFFDLLNSPSGASSTDVQSQVLADRDASQALLDRAEKIDVPGQMSKPQSAVELSLQLRRDALNAIAANVGQATATRETADAIETITNQMGSLYASDILWSQVAKPGITETLQDEGVEGTSLPAGNFMPANASDFLDQTNLVEKLNSIGLGGDTTTSGTHGLELLSTTIGDTTLTADSTTTVPSDAREIDVEVQNGGDSEESSIDVTVTLGGNEFTGTIDNIKAGDTTSVKIPLSSKPQPDTETSLEVVVASVPGETISDNNTADYTVVFGSG